MKKSLWSLLIVALVTLVTSASADPRRTPPPRELALSPTDLEVLNVMLDNAHGIQDAAKHGNGISRVSITAPNRSTTVYWFRIENCEGVRGCFGGARLTITRTARPSTPISFSYEVNLEVLRGSPGFPPVRSVREVSPEGVETISALFGKKVNGSSVSEDFADLSEISNSITEGTVTRVGPAVTFFRMKSQNCQIRTGRCLGGGLLSITRNAASLPGSPARVVYEAEIARIRNVLRLPR